MGQMLIRQIGSTEGAAVAVGLETPASGAVGRDVGTVAGLDPLGIMVTDDAAELFAHADAVLEFTSPEATVAHAKLAAQAHTIHVVGTTGLDAGQEASLRQAAKHTPIVLGANMSVGINLLLALVERVASVLGPDYDIEIVEMHHHHKVDAPSGTALALGRAAAAGRGVALDQVSDRGRDGLTGPRRPGDIGFASLRGGDVTGDHTVIFAGGGERIEIGHRAASREIYSRGAVRAALWAHARGEPGFYTMADVLGLTEG
jgi:4-hydroxy-tetrahydrodipicolinate reductase